MKQLIHNLKEAGVLHTGRISEAFSKVDRKDFVLPEYQDEAYADYPLPIGHGQTISQPYTVAFMLELLEPKQGEKILDLGSGSGWTTALLAHIVGSQGRVYGLERIPELVLLGKRNLKKYSFAQATILQAEKELGLAREAPFDRILASAAAKELPQELIQQLKIGGTLVIPVQGDILKVRKISDAETDIQKFEGFRFVPLVQ